jgi:hypothetical protein
MTYSRWFYRSRRQWVLAAADSLLPLLVGLLRPKTMVDVGCGTGLWVSAAVGLGVDATGLDGPWVRRQDLEMEASRFHVADLSGDWAAPRPADMALSLEVAEHLPPQVARRFVQLLTQTAPVVVFSAAIPGQGGQGHQNEQWPSYWISLFEESDYQVFDVLRPRIWKDARIPYWYRQNLLIFASKSHVETCNSLREKQREGDFGGMDLVHPEHSQRALQYPGVRALIRAFPLALLRTVASLPSWWRGADSRVPANSTPTTVPTKTP